MLNWKVILACDSYSTSTMTFGCIISLRFLINFFGLVSISTVSLTAHCNYVHAGYSKLYTNVSYNFLVTEHFLTFRRRIKSRLPFAGIIRRLPYSTRFQDKG